MRVKPRKLTFLLTISFLLSSLFTPILFPTSKGIVHADELADLIQKQKELEDELERIRAEQNHISNLISQEEAAQNNLSNSIWHISNQIRSTELTIQEKTSDIEKKETEISVLGIEIANTEVQIKELKEAINELETVVTKRTVESYKNSKITTVEHIVTADNIPSLVKTLKYFAAIREHDAQLFEDFVRSKEELVFQKDALSDKKAEVELLKSQIESERSELEKAREELAWQKEQKDQLLAESENKENQYNAQKQQLSSDEAQKSAELARLMDQIALASFGIGGEDVSQGDFIGRQGNTGYSFGSHLHFGVYKSGYSVNPITYLNNETLSWPLSNYRITQYYGLSDFATMCEPASNETTFNSYDCWVGPPIVRNNQNASAYPQKYGYYPYDWDRDGYPNIHNGIDLTAYDGAPITAATDGKVCYGHDGFGAQYAKIDHGEELLTVYWHLQEMELNTCN